MPYPLEPYVGKPQDERVSVVFRQGDAKCLGEPKRLRKGQRKEVDWALDAEGYDKPGADFRCKSRVVTRVAKQAQSTNTPLRNCPKI